MKVALRDPRIGPALKYAENIYPEEVGLPIDYQCVVWYMAFFSFFTVRLRTHTHGLAIDVCLSVCTSVCQTRVL